MADEQPGAELITPEEAERIARVQAQTTALRERAAAIQVRTDAEAQAAAEFLVGIKREAKETESARDFLVRPMNEHVKAINARFKPLSTALAEVERQVKDKVLGYQREMERKRQEEQARLDAENRAREEAAREAQRKAAAEAQRQREAAARAAAAAEAEAARKERERLAALEADQQTRRARLEKLPEDALHRIAAGGSEDAPLAQGVLDARREHREAQEAAARAQEAEAAARLAEQEARSAPPVESVALTVAGPAKLAGTSTRKRWTFEVTDPEKLPAWALMPDMPEIRRRVREGLRGPVPGLRIYQEDDLAVRAR